MADVATQINNVGDKIDNFQEKLADYFKTLADYDYDLAMTDLDGARGWYKVHEEKINQTQKEVDDKLTDVFALPFTLTGAEMAEKAFHKILVFW